MDSFYQTFGFIAAICAGIMTLTLFFTVIGYLKRLTSGGFDVMKLKGFIKEGRLVNVHLSGGKSVLGVRFVGFTNASGKAAIPHSLSSMVVLETEKKTRILIRSDTVRMIEEIENPA